MGLPISAINREKSTIDLTNNFNELQGPMKLEKLEALRGFAAVYVVLHHTLPTELLEFQTVNLKFLLRFGQEAVILFFLLSGFVIHYSYQRSRNKTFVNYFSKRALRIYIPLFAVFIASYLIESHNAGRLVDPMIFNLGQNILMLQDWDKVKPNVLAEPYMNNTPLWSLSYEWWFYMLYFPIARYFRNKEIKHTYIFAVTIAATVLYAVYPHFIPRLFCYFGMWWTGVFLADLYLQQKNITLRTAFLPIASLFAIITILSVPVVQRITSDQQLLLGFHPLLEVRHALFAFLVIISAILWKRIYWVGFNLLFKPFMFIAPISYTIYISHLPLMENSSFFNSIDHSIFRWLSYLGVMLVFSYLVEQVLYLRLKSHLMKNKK